MSHVKTDAPDWLIEALRAGHQEAVECDGFPEDHVNDSCPLGVGATEYHHQAAHVRRAIRARLNDHVATDSYWQWRNLVDAQLGLKEDASLPLSEPESKTEAGTQTVDDLRAVRDKMTEIDDAQNLTSPREAGT